MKKMAIAAVLYCSMVMPGWAASPMSCDMKIEECTSSFHAERNNVLKEGKSVKAPATSNRADAGAQRIEKDDHLSNLNPAENMSVEPGSPSILQWKKEMPIGSLSNYINEQNRLREAATLKRDPPDDSIVTTDREFLLYKQQQARDALCTNQECKMRSRYR